MVYVANQNDNIMSGVGGINPENRIAKRPVQVMRNDIPDLDTDEPEAVDLPELSLIEEGMVFDVLTESDNDENSDYCEVAMQEDIDQW